MGLRPNQGWLRYLTRASLAGLTFFGLANSGLAAEFVIKLKASRADFPVEVDGLKLRHNDMTVLDSYELGRLVKANIPDQSIELLRQLAVDDKIEYIVPNIKFHAVGAPNDPRYSSQWSHRVANSELAWDTTTGSRKVVVAVIDTGIDTNHEDLRANLWTNPNEIAGNGIDDDGNGYVDDIHGWDFKGNDSDPMDETSSKNPGHGTHCAGIVGAVGNNATGIAGMSQEVSLMAVRFLGADGSGDLYAGARAIDYATKNGAHIISASWGAAVQEAGAKPIIEAIGRANDAGVIFIAAAANDGKNNDVRAVYPANANFPNMISVAASQSDDTKPSWSNFGAATVHVAAPGHQILSTLPGNSYGDLSGTSMATPMVSGLAALLLAATDDAINGATMRALLQSSGAKVAIETACNCRIDANAAIQRVVNETMTIVPAATTLQPGQSINFTAWKGTGPFQFRSTNANVAQIDNTGKLTASALGETTVIVTDANNTTAESLTIRVANPPENGGQECPLGDPVMCQLMCAIQPDLPWCKM